LIASCGEDFHGLGAIAPPLQSQKIIPSRGIDTKTIQGEEELLAPVVAQQHG